MGVFLRVLCLAALTGAAFGAPAAVHSPRSQVHRAARMDKHAVTLPAGDPDWVRRPRPDFATPRGRSHEPEFKAATIETRDLAHQPPLKRNVVPRTNPAEGELPENVVQ